MDLSLDIEVRAALVRQKGDWQLIADESGVSYSWLSKFVNGHIDNPGYATLKKLREYLAVRESTAAAEASFATPLAYLKRKLKECGPKRWSAIAAETGCSAHMLRKVAYGDRENPGVATIQPVLNLFHAIDRGERTLPEPIADEQQPQAAT